MSNITSILSRRVDGKRDVFAAIVGLVLSLALVPLWLIGSQVYLQTVPIVLAGACLLYLTTVRTAQPFDYEDWTVRRYAVASAQVSGIGMAALVVVATVSGGRTLPVLLLAGGVGALILLQILLLSDRVLNPALVLAQIVGLAFVVRFAGLLTTPGVIGVDGWTHITQYAAAIADSGSLGAIADSKYYAAPFYHLTVAAAAQLLDLSPRLATYLVVGTTIPLTALFVYAATRYLASPRWALLAAAMFSVGDHVVRWGLHVIPTSLGLVFFLVVLFYVVRLLHAETRTTDTLALAAFAVAVTLTHQVSAFITLTLLGAGVFAGKLVAREGTARRGSDNPVSLTGVFVFHLGFTAVVWSMTPWHDSRFLFRAPELLFLALARSAGFLDLVESGGGAAGGSTGTTLAATVAQYVDAAGFLLLLFVAVVGSLALLGRHRSTQAAYTVICAIVVMLTFAFVLPIFGVRTFLPGRWFAFAYAPLAIAGAVGIWHVVDRYPSQAVMAGLVVLLAVFPGAMMTSQKATIDNPTFQDQWPKYAYTESELAAVETIGTIVPETGAPLHTDHPYRTVFTRTDAHPAATINLTEGAGNLSAAGPGGSPYEFVVYRTYQSEAAPQFTAAGGVVVTRQIARGEACPASRNYVYDNQNTLLCTSSELSSEANESAAAAVGDAGRTGRFRGWWT